MSPLLLVLRFLASAGVGWLTWALTYVYGHDETLIEWTCYGAECSTNDWQSIGLVGGIAAAIVFGLLAAPLTQRATPGIAVVLAAGGLAHGWYDSTRDLGVTGIDGWIVGALAVAGVGGVAALIGAWHSIRRSAIIPRLFGGNTTVPGRAYDWIDTGRPPGQATVAFIDHTGRRHDVPVPLARHYCDRPLIVIYDPRTPGAARTPRVGVPRQPLTAAKRRDDMKRLRETLPIDDDAVSANVTESTIGDTPAGRPSITADLERLARLKADGALTEEEFTAAKRRLLGL